MGCGESAPEVDDGQKNGVRKKRGNQKNIKIEVNEDPEKQGEKFHVSGESEIENESEKNSGGGENNNDEKDSFDDF